MTFIDVKKIVTPFKLSLIQFIKKKKKKNVKPEILKRKTQIQLLHVSKQQHLPPSSHSFPITRPPAIRSFQTNDNVSNP